MENKELITSKKSENGPYALTFVTPMSRKIDVFSYQGKLIVIDSIDLYIFFSQTFYCSNWIVFLFDHLMEYLGRLFKIDKNNT